MGAATISFAVPLPPFTHRKNVFKSLLSADPWLCVSQQSTKVKAIFLVRSLELLKQQPLKHQLLELGGGEQSLVYGDRTFICLISALMNSSGLPVSGSSKAEAEH